MAQERLDKLLSSTGRWSRREVKELIRQGRVWVDGVPARRPEEKCEPRAGGRPVGGARGGQIARGGRGAPGACGGAGAEAENHDRV